jgi:hypothetical protein
LLAFGIMAALERQSTALTSLFTRVGECQAGDGRTEITKTMAMGESASDRLENQIALQIYKVANRADLTPDELLVAGVRFAQSAKRSSFKKLLAPALADWVRKCWAYAIEEQRFYLRNPSTAVPLIKEALTSSDVGLAFVGKLFVAIEPAVKSRFDQSFREFLLSL